MSKKAALICWLINELPLTKERRPSPHKQCLHGRCAVLSPPSLPFLQTVWVRCRDRHGAPQVGRGWGWGGPSFSDWTWGRARTLPAHPAHPWHAHMELTEIHMQLRNTRQPLAPSLHQQRLRGSVVPPPTPALMPGNKGSHRSPAGKADSHTPPLLPQNSSLRSWPCGGEPTKCTEQACGFAKWQVETTGSGPCQRDSC